MYIQCTRLSANIIDVDTFLVQKVEEYSLLFISCLLLRVTSVTAVCTCSYMCIWCIKSLSLELIDKNGQSFVLETSQL